MKNLNRRQWLRRASLASAATLIGGVASAESVTFPARPLPAEGPIRLSSNENPYGPAPSVRQAIIDSFDLGCRYPYAWQEELLERIADREGLSKEHIVITGGSTEGLKITGLTYGLYGGEILTAAPTFKAMSSYAAQFGAHINAVPLTDSLHYDLEEMGRRITNNTKLVFLCNPNNPTGTLLPAAQVRDFCNTYADRCLIFSDEAYGEYIEEDQYPSMTEWVRRGKNVIVSRTFSKVYGLAGIRIGYLLARPDIAERLAANRVAFTNMPALFAANAALRDQEFYQYSLQQNRKCKQMIYDTLDELGLPYVSSHTNFVFFKTGRSIATFGAAMLNTGVQVGRPFPPLLDWCRISTGTEAEVARFCEGLRQVI